MADTKISALPAVTAPVGTDEFPVNQGGTSKKDSRENMAMFVEAPIFCVLDADYTLTSTGAAQKLFNKSTNGAVTVAAGLYWMECLAQITGMSGTSGNGVFSLAGTATLANPRLLAAYGLDNTTQPTGAALGGAFVQGGTAFTTNTVTAATGTAMGVHVQGLVAVTASGTIVPSIALTTAAAAVVKAGSVFILRKIGAATDTTRGTWS